MIPHEAPALFERVPATLFGPLSSTLAPLYWTLLARFYQHEFEREPFHLVRIVAIEEAENILAASSLWSERRAELFAREEDSGDELDGTLDEASLRSASARRLVTRLERAGWFRFEYRSGIGDVLSFYPYAARILEALVRVARDEQPVFQGYAHTIAALLRPEAFAAQPGAALSEAVRHTLELVRELKILNRNIALRTQRLLDEAEQASDVLDHGFAQYEHAVHASYHRLKTSHNLFKWRGDVLARLEAIDLDTLALSAATRWVAEQSALDLEAARSVVMNELALVRMQFETLPEVTDDIDRRNARFSGTALRKLMYLLRQDKRTEGQLQYLLDQLCAENDAELELDVFRCELLCQDFLHSPPKKRPRVERQPLRDDSTLDKRAIREHTLDKLRSRLSRNELEQRVLAMLADRKNALLSELGLGDDEEFVNTIYAAAFGLDGLSSYELDFARRLRAAWRLWRTARRAVSTTRQEVMMDFCSEYPRLEPAQAERFRRVVTRLLSGHVLSPGSALAPDADWRFAERHHALIDAYLCIGGWSFELDPALRLGRAVHIGGEQRARFNKLESLTTVMLRLVYHEQMQQASESSRCTTSVGDLRERMVQAGRPAHQLQRRALHGAFRKLQRHSLVALERGFQAEDDELVTVLPVIEKVLPPARIAELAKLVRAYVGEDERGEDPEVEDAGGPEG